VGQFVKENAHLKTDQKAFEEGWERVFGKKEPTPQQEPEKAHRESAEQPAQETHE
jgi:hypothetical protein